MALKATAEEQRGGSGPTGVPLSQVVSVGRRWEVVHSAWLVGAGEESSQQPPGKFLSSYCPAQACCPRYGPGVSGSWGEAMAAVT